MSNQTIRARRDDAEFMKPVPLKRRLGYAAFGAGFLALAVYMFMNPHALTPADAEGIHRRAIYVAILGWLWGRTFACFIGLFGLLMFFVAAQKTEDSRTLKEIAEARAKEHTPAA